MSMITNVSSALLNWMEKCHLKPALQHKQSEQERQTMQGKKMHLQLICGTWLKGDGFRTTVNLHEMQANKHTHLRNMQSLTRHPASLSAHSPSRAPRTRRENFLCLIAWVQVRGSELQWQRLIAAPFSVKSEQHAAAEHTPTPKGGWATFKGENKMRRIHTAAQSVCVCVCGLLGAARWLIHAI